MMTRRFKSSEFEVERRNKDLTQRTLRKQNSQRRTEAVSGAVPESCVVSGRICVTEVPMPTAEEFREQLIEVFRVSEERRLASVVVNAGDLHRRVGGYPNRSNHRMPVCCEVMRSTMRRGDVIVDQPRKGKGAALTVRYLIPRPRQGGTA